MLVAGLLVTLALFLVPVGPTVQQVGYSQLKIDIAAGQVSSVAIGPDGSISGKLKNGTSFTSSYLVGLQDPQFVQLLDEHNVQVTAQAAQTSIWSVLLNLLPLALIVGLFVWSGRAARRQLAGLGGIAGIGRSRGKLFDTERPDTTFADVAGYEGAKREVTEVVDFLKHPDRYQRAGAVGPKGVLMVGPPGTGKTLLARAVAGEAGVPFISVTGSSFVEMFVGVGAARVRDLFADARKRAPSIVFIDEIDAIGQRRGGQLISNDERDQTLNQMLAELDGFDPTTGVVLIAATNRPEVLDPALLRPGRFDRQVVIPLPTRRERREILKVHIGGKVLGPDVDLDVVARATPGFSGADLSNLINEAAIFAVRAGRQVIEAVDFAEARDRILLGHRDSSNALLPDEKHAVAVPRAATRWPRCRSTATRRQAPPAAGQLRVTEQLRSTSATCNPRATDGTLAIRWAAVANELSLARLTVPATTWPTRPAATRMVREFGMSTAPARRLRLGQTRCISAVGDQQPPYAEATQRVIDQEVAKLLREAEHRATTTLTDHRNELDRLTELLMERETVDGTDVDQILGRDSGSRRPVGAGMGPAAGSRAP